MSQRKSISTEVALDSEKVDAIGALLNTLPESASNEIIKAFNAMGVKQYLPPKLFLDIVDQAPEGISITDPTASILYVNSAFEALSGYQRSELTGKNQSVLSSKSTPNEVYRKLWETINDQRVWRGTLVNHRKDGQEYVAELVISPVLDAQGKTLYFLGMHRDITALHQLEQRLKFQKRLTEAALDAAPMVVAMVAADGTVLLDNHAYKALLGDFRGAEPVELFLDALNQQIGFQLDTPCADSDGFTNIEVRLDPPGSAPARWFACSGVRVSDQDEAAQNYFKREDCTRRRLLFIANEITTSRRRFHDARLNMIRASMAEQQMVQTMREAIHGSLYKLQAPLNIIKAALSMPGHNGESAGLRLALRQALATGEEAMESLHDALPKASLEQASLVNVNEILQEIITLSVDTLLANGIIVDWRPTPSLPTVSGRANALRGLFKYLIDNAMQAVGEAGASYREIRLETQLDGDEVLVAVIDNGVGLPAALRLKAFEPFYCGWSQARGHAGMGLTMAQEVANNHGGSIEIDSEFLGGCRVFVRLNRTGSEGQNPE